MENSYCLFLTYPVGLGTSRQDQHVKAIWVPYCHLKLVWSAIKPVFSSSSVCVYVSAHTQPSLAPTPDILISVKSLILPISQA